MVLGEEMSFEDCLKYDGIIRNIEKVVYMYINDEIKTDEFTNYFDEHYDISENNVDITQFVLRKDNVVLFYSSEINEGCYIVILNNDENAKKLINLTKTMSEVFDNMGIALDVYINLLRWSWTSAIKCIHIINLDS